MKRIVFIVIIVLFALRAIAQIPYFAGTVGDGKLYGYTSLKGRPGLNQQETYTTFQYGLSSHVDAGIDLYTGPDCAYWGALIRGGLPLCQWFNVGGEVIASLDLNDRMHFSYLTSGLYLNGAITPDNRLFWCSNTWWVRYRGGHDTYSNYEYLGYHIPLPQGRSLTPMVGAVHSWQFDDDLQPAAGLYFSFGAYNLYLWSHDLLATHPRFVLGLDFVL